MAQTFKDSMSLNRKFLGGGGVEIKAEILYGGSMDTV